MSQLFPKTIQSCILFQKRGFFSRGSTLVLEDLAAAYMKIQATKHGHSYNVVEHVRGKVIQFYGGSQLMIRLELMEVPANKAVFAQALGSPFTKLSVPDARDIIESHGSHLLIDVRHGVMPDLPEFSALLAQAGINEGHSLAQFCQRLEICALLTSIAHELGNASLVHWTQSNMLLRPTVFDKPAELAPPTMLHVHPILFAGKPTADGRETVSIITHGVEHFIGREIEVVESPIPWTESYQAALTFLKVATMENGYVVPDGDNMGIEGGDFSYRVTHIPEGERDGQKNRAFYQLALRYSKSHGYQSPHHQPDGPKIDIANPPPEARALMGDNATDQMTRWENRRETAARAGIQFQVTMPRPGSPRPPVFGKRV